ncbi:lipase class 3 family protein [Euphorbia peplus]|nr:lipase class 3 family protein [Euphorbia peplus]
MDSLQSKVETWIRDQKARILKASWGPLQWRMRWPPWVNTSDREHRKKMHLEYQRRRKQLHDLCLALKADSISDLQDILCCMVLSECVYKRPAIEVVRTANKFKADFGGHVISLERVQPSSDHVPHRYLLAEAGDTLFASFIGTKQYKDIMTDVNILQGEVFHEDGMEGIVPMENVESGLAERQKGNVDNPRNPLESKSKQLKDQPKPAAHRGFLARAKGIPALELYRLAQKKNRKLVLCGHSLGGAVAALATLAILRVIAASSPSKENEKIQVKCVTFSQPPVGNAALRDYVHEKGWQHHFKSYCIPEDLVPRILSPAYFHHYNAQAPPTRAEVETASQSMLKQQQVLEKPKEQKPKVSEGEQLVIGLGPIQTSLWRLSRLVPLEGLIGQFSGYRRKEVGPVETPATDYSAVRSPMEDVGAEPQSLEIQENFDGVSLKPLSNINAGLLDEAMSGKSAEKGNDKSGDRNNWRKVPYLPSYVPFGQLYLLEHSSVELLSGAEYLKKTSVRSVIAELRERLQSHSMRSYRSRFQRIYDMCMGDFPGMEQLHQFPHLRQWLGVAVADAVELAQIVELPVIRTATSLVPLGWNGAPGEKNGEPLKVDITGFGLHLCNLVHAQVNGNWCATRVESFPPAPSYSSSHEVQPELQQIRVLVGAPMKQPPKYPLMAESMMAVFPSIDPNGDNANREHSLGHGEKILYAEGLSDFCIFCTSDFATVSKEVHVRTRRVRLLGLEDAGKTSLFKAIMGEGRLSSMSNFENLHIEANSPEGIAGGVCYVDSDGVNLQNVSTEASRFRDELWMGIRDLCRKTDLIILVHNMSHKIPRISNTNASLQQPVLSLLLDEAKTLGIPWVLAITNKFSVSAHLQKEAIDAVLHAYQTSLASTEVVNSCPYVIHGANASASLSLAASERSSGGLMGAQNLIFAPINLVRKPFQRRETVFPVDGVTSLCQLVHRVLRCHEEASLQELARDRLLAEVVRERAMAIDARQAAQAKASSLTAAAVGASLGAGVGLALAVVMGAASALRKP